MSETQIPTAAEEAAIIRAAAHSAAPATLRAPQRFCSGVTDLDLARVMRALESGIRPYRNKGGRWFMPSGTAPTGLGYKLSTIVNEMIRTGLVRHYRTREGDFLLPAPVHYRNHEDRGLSACLFVGEDMGPMRARLVDRLDLVDCGDCERVVSTGEIRAGWRA
jgi:hypothetical protein